MELFKTASVIFFVSESNRGGKKQRDLSSYQNSLRPNWPGWAQFGGKNDDILHKTLCFKSTCVIFLEVTCHFPHEFGKISGEKNFINSNFQIFRGIVLGR